MINHNETSPYQYRIKILLSPKSRQFVWYDPLHLTILLMKNFHCNRTSLSRNPGPWTRVQGGPVRGSCLSWSCLRPFWANSESRVWTHCVVSLSILLWTMRVVLMHSQRQVETSEKDWLKKTLPKLYKIKAWTETLCVKISQKVHCTTLYNVHRKSVNYRRINKRVTTVDTVVTR